MSQPSAKSSFHKSPISKKRQTKVEKKVNFSERETIQVKIGKISLIENESTISNFEKRISKICFELCSFKSSKSVSEAIVESVSFRFKRNSITIETTFFKPPIKWKYLE
jgi:hypothetical protein